MLSGTSDPISISSHEERRSRFICYIYELDSHDRIKEILSDLKEAHKRANHILRACRYANSFGVQVSEYSENQEPINAMKKLVTLMENKHIADTGIFIVRYFGGNKLGASHLEHVYLQMGLDALECLAQRTDQV